MNQTNNTYFDAISLGEVMLRLDPGAGRIKTARSFSVWEGGGEYNAIRGLSKCFGLKTAIITAFADNEIGRLIEDLIMQGGIDTSLVKWLPYDGIGKSVRNGLNFTERGFGLRGALGVSDRANTAISQMSPNDFDFDYIFGQLGCKWFHTGGIYAGLSENSAQTALAAVKAAKKYGVAVSYDLNYRASLWQTNGGPEKAIKINKEIAQYADVMIGNEDDFTLCLGFDIEKNNTTGLNIDGNIKMLEAVSAEYPNFKAVVSTILNVKSASVNDFTAVCCSGGKTYRGTIFENMEIYDRVGGGDSFASGFIYGLITQRDIQYSLDCGITNGALSMTTPGDNSMASKKEIETLMKGCNAAVTR